MRHWVLLFSFLGGIVHAQEHKINFKPGTFEDAQAILSASSQLIFIAATADWCESCKLMDQSVYVDSRVSDFYNQHFYNLKLNIEKATGPLFAARFEIDTLPTMLFVTSDGTLLSKVSGYKKATELLLLAEAALIPSRLKEALQARYNEGDRKPDFLIHYLDQIKPLDETMIIKDYLDNRTRWTDGTSIKLLWRLPDSILIDYFDFIIDENAKITATLPLIAYHGKLTNLLHQRLYCSTPALDLSQAAQLIHRTSLPDHKALIAGYQLYYYKEIKKDIDGFIRAQISVWNTTSAPLDRNEFDSDLTTLLNLHPALPIYKEVVKIIKHQPALLASPQSLFLLARLYEQQKQPRKALRWLRKTEQLIPDTALQLQIIALRHKIRS